LKFSRQNLPMISANDEEIKLVSWLCGDGEFVKQGHKIAAVETSKAVFEVEAEGDGYLFQLLADGETYEIGRTFAVIAERNDPAVKNLAAVQESRPAQDGQRRWTKKAGIIARKHGISLEGLNAGELIRESDVLAFIRSSRRPQERHEKLDEPRIQKPERLLILGAGVGAFQLISTVLKTGHQSIVVILDDNPSLTGRKLLGFEVLGPISRIRELWKTRSFDGAVISFSKNIEIRSKIYEELSAQGIPFANIVDPSVHIGANVRMGSGNVILTNGAIGACALIGNNNFVSTFANIEHHCRLGDGCSFGPGVMLSGEVEIGNQVKFGTGIFIEPKVRIGDRAVIASGSVLTCDVADNAVVKKRVDLKIEQAAGRARAEPGTGAGAAPQTESVC